MPVYMTYNSGNIWNNVSTYLPFMFIEPINWQIIMCISMSKSVRLLSFALDQTKSLVWYEMVNNQTHSVTVKVIADYDYICNVINYDYDYVASG